MTRGSRPTAALAVGLGLSAGFARPQTPPAAPSPAIAVAIEQLRHANGEWAATTEFLKPDGSVARRATGTYRFDWIVPDRVLQGRSDIPELGMTSGLLFYVGAEKAVIEMASVGPDGHLWVMSGPADGEVRTTPPTSQADGSVLQLRFTRTNVAPDRFESRMEYTTDGGKTWLPGNRQVFERKPCSGASGPDPVTPSPGSPPR